MKRKYETGDSSDQDLFSDLSGEDSYIAFADKLEENYYKDLKQKSKEFTCDIYGKKFKRMQYLIKHKLSQSLFITCDICNRNFTRLDTLKGHKRRKHGEVN